MKCPEIVLDHRSNPPKTRICNAEIYGLTGLQEALAFRKHLNTKHKQRADLLEAVEYRAESEQ
jgi:hypothetical protein